MTPLYWPLSVPTLTAIQQDEGLRLKTYKCPAGVWTIGYGATGRGVVPGLTWTKAQCEERFLRDVEEVARGVTQLLKGSAPTTRNQFEALVSFAYNTGLDIDDDHTAEGLGDSTLLRLHRAGRYNEAAGEFAKWIKGGRPQKIIAGLVHRRAREKLLYCSLDDSL